MRNVALATLALAIAALACSTGPTTPRPNIWNTSTPVVVTAQVTKITIVTTTPVVIEVTPTSRPPIHLCVVADEAVYLRPSPSVDNYPITEMVRNSQVVDLGGRSGTWLFVRYGTYDGWVNLRYVKECSS